MMASERVPRHERCEEYLEKYLRHYPPVPFPALSGLRPELYTDTRHSVSRVKQFPGDLQRALSYEPDASSATALKLAVLALLSSYYGPDVSDIAFGLIREKSVLQATNERDGLPMVIPVRCRIETNGGPKLTVREAIAQLVAHEREITSLLEDSNSFPSFTIGQPAVDTFVVIGKRSHDLDDDFCSAANLRRANVVIQVTEGGTDALEYKATFTNAHLNEQAARLMLEQLDEIFHWILHNPSTPVEMAISCVSIRFKALSNPRTAHHAAEICSLQNQFEDHAASTPGRIALIFTEELNDGRLQSHEFSYGTLNAKAERLAKYLAGCFVDMTNQFIPVLMDKSPELYIAILGILKSGAAWCPIDSLSPAERQCHLIARTESPLLLTNSSSPTGYKSILPKGVEVINVEEVLQKSTAHTTTHSRKSRQSLAKEQRPSERIAYLIWTSGTTGPPKGVLVSHTAAVASMVSLQKVIPGPSDETQLRCMQFSQPTFDVFVQDVFYTWGLGGAVITASRDLMTGSFTRVAALNKATHANLTPAFGATVSRSSCPTLEVVTMIGERLPQHVADDWGEDMQAFNVYGPAEAAVVSTLKKFKGKDEPIRSSNIGKPLPSVSCYVVRNSSLAMLNGVGELALGGLQLAHGYLNDPTKTAEKFFWNEETGERLYSTGDVVRMLVDGTLEFLGRKDDLIKLQGIRVELSEISFILKECHAAIKQVETCHMKRHDRPSQVLVAFMVVDQLNMNSDEQGFFFDNEAANLASSTLEAAKARLSDYMIPSVILICKELPRTASAKVDRKSLQAIYENADLALWESKINLKHGPKDEDTVWTAEEEKILQAVVSLSKVPLEKLKRSSYLPALGLDSISSGKLSSLLKHSNIHMKVSDITGCRTLGELLEKPTNVSTSLDRVSEPFLKNFSDYWLSCLAGDGRNFSIVLPLTIIQESLLVENMTDTSSYWSNHFYKLSPDINLERLKDSWQAVGNQNEALRTIFAATADVSAIDPPAELQATIIQAVLESHAIDWEVIGTSLINEEEITRRRSHYISREVPVVSSNRPPWAVSILCDQDRERFTMMFTIHHALHDEVSLDFLVTDVWRRYENLRSNTRCQLQDVVARMYPLGNRSIEDSTFWQNTLEDLSSPENLTLPDLGSRSETRGVQEKRQLNSAYIQFQDAGIARVAAALRVSPVNLFKAAWGSLLLRYLETSRLVFGETLSERIFQPDIADAIAPMISVLPVPFRVNSTAKTTLEELEALALNSRAHRTVSGQWIRKFLQRPRPQPLYPALFVFIPEESGDMPPDSCPWLKMDDFLGLHVEHSLALNVSRREGQQWRLQIFADAGIMDHAHLVTLTQQMQSVVQAMAMAPDKPIHELFNTLSGNVRSLESSTLLGSLSTQQTEDPAYWAALHADIRPLWKAVEITDTIVHGQTKLQGWTFTQLDRESNKIAAYLSTNRLRNQMVALCTRRSLISYAVILGIFKSGNTYLPIDDGLPHERKILLLEDSKCRFLFTDNACEASFKNTPKHCMVSNLDDNNVKESIASFDGNNRIQLGRHDDNAYLLYTSGSTGKPKGVLISNRNLCGFVEGLAAFIGHCSPATHSKGGLGKFLGLASRAFDVHLCEIFLGWRLGLSVVTAPREALLDDLRLALNELRVTHACFVPSLLDQASLEPGDVPGLVYFSVGGEKISQRILTTWGTQKKTLVVNAYGPTEVAIGCCASMLKPDSNARNVGKPFGNTTAHVLLPETNDYAIRGQSGELCITGDLVGNGYFERPDAVGFIDNFEGQRMYRTGDLVRMMADGSLEYLGRSDDQTKIRGQRIELAEVSESIRNASKRATDVATLLLQHPELSQTQLISFVSYAKERSRRYGAQPVLESHLQRWACELQSACKTHIPGYMVPNYVLPVSVIPLAPISGKADAKILKAFFSSLALSQLLSISKDSDSSHQDSRPMSKDEELVQDTIKGIMKIEYDSLSFRSNIFELGFDSLSAITLTMRLKKRGFDSNLLTVLSHPTIEELALLPKLPGLLGQTVEGTRASTSKLVEFETRVRQELVLDASSIEKARPCLPLQEGVIARSLDDPTRGLYINHVTLRLQDTLDISRLKKAWIEVIQDNQILRTCFRPTKHGIIQVVLDTERDVFDWTEENCLFEELDAPILESIQADSARDILGSIECKPPVRFRLFKAPQSPRFLYISIHHALYDASSFNMIMNDVYDKYQGGDKVQRVPFDIFLDYIVSQDRDGQKDFWTDYLSGCIPSSVSYATQKSKPSTFIRPLKLELSNLRALASKLKATLPILTQSIFGAVLARKLRKADFVFGVVLSGRSLPIVGTESIAAPCMTTVPCRIQFQNSNSSLASAISNVHSKMIECLEFQQVSLRDIQRWSGNVQMFDCLFQYLGELNEKPRYSSLWTEQDSSMPPDYPLAFELAPDTTSNKLIARMVCTVALEDEEWAQSFLEQFDMILLALERNNNVLLRELDVSKDMSLQYENKAVVYDEQHWSDIEVSIRDIAAKFCGIATSLVTKNITFFQLGLDSVSALAFSRQLRQAGIDVRSSITMKYPSIGALGAYLNDHNAGNFSTSRQESSTKYDIEKLLNLLMTRNRDSQLDMAYPCTPLQTGMLTATLASKGDMYVHHHIVSLRNAVSLARLRQACHEVANAHDILRTSFHFMPDLDSPWVAAVHRTPNFNWSEIRDSISIERFVERLSAQMIFKGTNSFEVPPIRFTTLTTPSDSFFILSLHHCLYDGLSIPLIFADIHQAYVTGSLEQHTQFHEAAALMAERRAASVEFWTETLGAYHSSNFPRRGTIDDSHFIHRDAKLSIGDVLHRSRSLDVTLQSIVLLAFSKLLACQMKRRDVVFGHVVAGRSLPLAGCESIRGPLFNTVPFRLCFDDLLRTNAETARAVQKFTADAQEHQHASLQEIQRRWRSKTGTVQSSLFNALFLFQRQEDSSFPGAELWTPHNVEAGITQSEYPFNFEVEQTPHRIVLRASSHDDFLSRDDLAKTLDLFEAIVEEILGRPDRQVAVFPDELSTMPLELGTEQITKAPEPLAHESTPMVVALTQILSNVSGVPAREIKADTSIYALGLDSILAIKVASACRSQGLNLSVADVIQGETVYGISGRASFDRGSSNDLINETTDIPVHNLNVDWLDAGSVETILPSLSGQRFNIAAFKISGRSYPLTFAYEDLTKLDFERLQAAWVKLRHQWPILRAVFVRDQQHRLVQVILKPQAPSLTSISTVHDKGDNNLDIKSYVAEASRRIFKRDEPPVHLTLLRSEERDVLLLTMSHGLYDAWSISMLLTDLTTLYYDQSPSPRPDFLDFARHALRSQQSQSAKPYWQRALHGFRPTIIAPSPSASRVHRTFASLPSAIPSIPALIKACKAHNLPPQPFLLAAFGAFLARKTGTPNPVFGHYPLGRSSFPGAEKVPGPCVNVLPLVVRDALTRTPVEASRAIRDELAGRIAFEQCDLQQVLGWMEEIGGFDAEGSEDAKGGSRTMFNAYLNILWDRNVEGAQEGDAAGGEEKEPQDKVEKALFEQLDIGVPADYMALEPTAAALDVEDESAQPAPTSLLSDTEYPLPRQALYVDVALAEGGQSAMIAATCTGGLVNKAELEAWLDEFRDVILEKVGLLGGEIGRGD